MITDRQVALLRQRRMEGKTQETAAAMSGMSVRSARKWERGPLPSATKQERRWRTRPDPFEGVWEEEIEPLLRGDPSRQAQGNDNYGVAGGPASRPIRRHPAPHPATAIAGLAGAARSRPGGLLPPGASAGTGSPDRLHPRQLPGGHHRRPALPPPVLPADPQPLGVALRRGCCRRDLPGPQAGTASRPLDTGRSAKVWCAPTMPRPSPTRYAAAGPER